MGESSFKKICRALAVTPEFKDYKLRFKAAVEQAKIVGWEFLDRGTDRPMVVFNVEIPGFASLKISGNPGEWVPPMYHLCSDKGLMGEVAQPNWGKKSCPTYNCKFTKLGDHWPDVARNVIMDEMGLVIEEMKQRVRDQGVALMQDPQLQLEHQEFHERVIVEAIKTVLIQYKDVANAKIYKLALDEFVAHEIMES